MADVLVDTDLFIDHLRGARALAPGSHRVHYSVVTRAELFAGNSAPHLVSTLLAPFREIPVDRTVAERAGRIRRENDIRLPDALIAATAIEHNSPWRLAIDPTSSRYGPFAYEICDSIAASPSRLSDA